MGFIYLFAITITKNNSKFQTKKISIKQEMEKSEIVQHSAKEGIAGQNIYDSNYDQMIPSIYIFSPQVILNNYRNKKNFHAFKKKLSERLFAKEAKICFHKSKKQK